MINPITTAVNLILAPKRRMDEANQRVRESTRLLEEATEKLRIWVADNAISRGNKDTNDVQLSETTKMVISYLVNEYHNKD